MNSSNADTPGFPTNDAAIDKPLSVLLRLMAAGVGSFQDVPKIVIEARAAGIHVDQVRALGLQVALFSGVPRAINVLAEIQKVYGPADKSAAVAMKNIDLTRSMGLELFKRIYDDNTETVLASLKALDPQLSDFVLIGAYGFVLCDPRLSPRVRELAAIVALLVSGDLKQLSSHIRGAARCGASRNEIAATSELAAAWLRPGASSAAREIFERVDYGTK